MQFLKNYRKEFFDIKWGETALETHCISAELRKSDLVILRKINFKMYENLNAILISVTLNGEKQLWKFYVSLLPNYAIPAY